MAAKSIIATLTASETQQQITDGGFTRDQAAVHFGFSNGGALINALGRYHRGVTFSFAKPNGNGNGGKTATPAPAPVTAPAPAANGNGAANGAMGKPVAGVVSGYWQAMAGPFGVPALDKQNDIVVWFAANQTSPFVAGLDGSIDPHIVDAFCGQFGVQTPAHCRRNEEAIAKQRGQIRAAVKAVSIDGRFVVGPLGVSQSVIDHATQIASIADNALELAQGKPAGKDEDGSEVAAVAPDIDAAVGRISAAKAEIGAMERQLAALTAAIRLTINDCRLARDEARHAIASMEEQLQPVITKLANERRYTPEQAGLIQSAMGLGMSEQEAISFLKGKGKL